MSQALAHIPAYDAGPDDDVVWKTMNGTAVPFKDGEPVGKVGEKVKASGSDPIQAAKNLGEKSKAGTLTKQDSAVVVSVSSLGDTPLHELTKGPKARELEKSIVGDLENQITGEKISLSATKAKHLTSSALNKGEGGLAHIAAVQNVHSIMAGAIPTVSTPDAKKQQDVKSVQRFYGAMDYEKSGYRVVMTVKEYEGGRFVELEGVKKLYDIKLDKKIPGQGFAALANKGVQPKPGTSAITIEQLLDGVKESPILSRKDAAQDAALRNPDCIAFDRATHRHTDENGFLHVEVSHISKETVNPYYGREVPGWEKLGLDSERVYHGYRKGEELAKGAETFNGLPLLLGHYPESADEPQKEHRVGSLGTDAAFSAPYLDNSLIITDAAAIEAIESGEAVELSSAYRYEPDFTPGEFNGERYDFIMTNIRGNHVALVEEGRAGPDVAVADEQINPKPKSIRKNIMGKLSTLAKALLLKSGLAADEAEVVEAAEKLVEAIGEEVAEQALEGGGTNFDEEAAKILQDEELDEAGKVEALKKLAEGLKDVVEAEKQTTDNEPDKQTEDPAANDSPEECAELMKAAGLDPADEAARAAFMAGMKASKGATDEDPGTEDEGGSPDDKKPEGASDGRSAKKSKPLTAQDAALIRSQAKTEAAAETKAHFRSLTDAARAVRDLCGEVDPLAFDSAADIYRHALKASGRSVTTKDAAALKDMVGMALDAKANAAVAHAPAFDTRKMDGAFSGLNRITIQQ